jgi:hypothetical protein
MEITTRQATAFDAVDILKLLIAMHSEAKVDYSPVHEAKSLAAINHAISDGYVEVALQDGYVVGTIGGMTFTDWWSTEQRLGDLFFYVAQECRKSRAAILLIEKFKEAAIRADMPLKVGTADGGDLERKDKFFLKRGFTRGGSHYIMER